MKNLTLLALAALLTLGPWLPASTNARDKDPVLPLVPRGTFATAAANKGGSLELIAKKFVDFSPTGVALVPSNPLVTQSLETSAILSLTIPEDKKRTHFLINTGALHSWEQISSTANYRITGALRYRLVSAALPAPGEMSFGIGLEGQLDGQPSTQVIARIRDQTASIGLDDEVLAFLVKGNFPSLTEEQALEVARALIESEIAVTMTVRVAVRSVSEFGITNAYLQVWGD